MTTATTIAVKLGSRECGFAVFSDRRLTHKGVWRLRPSQGDDSRRYVFAQKLRTLITRHGADALILEKLSKRCFLRYPVLAELAQEVRKAAEKRSVRLHSIDSGTIRRTVTDDPTATKRMVARAVCHRFPELRKRLEQAGSRHQWYLYRMCDAVACGIAFLHRQERASLTHHAGTR